MERRTADGYRRRGCGRRGLGGERLKRREERKHEAKVRALLKVAERPEDVRARRARPVEAAPEQPHPLRLLRAERPVLGI